MFSTSTFYLNQCLLYEEKDMLSIRILSGYDKFNLYEKPYLHQKGKAFVLKLDSVKE